MTNRDRQRRRYRTNSGRQRRRYRTELSPQEDDGWGWALRRTTRRSRQHGGWEDGSMGEGKTRTIAEGGRDDHQRHWLRLQKQQ